MAKAAGLSALDKAERKRDRRRRARHRWNARRQERSIPECLGKTGHLQSASYPSKQLNRKKVKRVDAPKAVKVCRFGRSSKCWFLPTEVDGVEMDILVDTGAERSIMSERMYSRLPTEAHTPLEASDAVFDGIGGRKESYGLATFTYRVGDRVFKHPMNVIDMTDLDAILGMDMLTFIGASINVRSGLMTFDDGGYIQLSQIYAQLLCNHVC